MRGGCGSEVVLETVNATRAFLTIDSGFPLAELEQALRTNRPFAYDYQPTRRSASCMAPTTGNRPRTRRSGEFIDYFLGDPSLCRLYLGLSKLDPRNRRRAAQAIPAPRLKAVRARAGFLRRHVPDPRRQSRGARRRAVGKSLGRTGRRIARQRRRVLRKAPVAKDDGWLASYFDALARDRTDRCRII